METGVHTGCPVCNGFDALEVACPHCTEWMEDRGRFFDLLADYSPYRPIEDMKKTDGFCDLESHQCPHHLFCQNCGFYDLTLVEEIPI
ncbi:hypothetical protein C8P63_11383 [Melghirimyces profundicolus]|uniref:Uncharacterized protein n=1 Tax=Melghirimyces profundicolus TaxID=1242148 RepID=A0A2T6BST0_9BACL|nr:hypothetical protein [Melghirimyces profundicolus]PTX59138.1 hypothetical protein C8P63_11383 [Melghirimyces profundicolus]